MALVTVAATQMACTWDIDGNVARAEKLVREAAAALRIRAGPHAEAPAMNYA